MSLIQPKETEKASLGVSAITFVPELQPQSNSTGQKKKARRRKAPIYWGKKPSKKKTDAKRKLDSDLDLAQEEKEVVENGDQRDSDTEDLAEESAEEETVKADESEKGVVVNCEIESEKLETEDKGDEDDVMLVENGGDTLVNGEVVLLDSKNSSEICDKLNSKSTLQNVPEHLSQLPKQTLNNHVLIEKVSSLANGIPEEGCSEEHMEDRELECFGEKTSNDIVYDRVPN